MFIAVRNGGPAPAWLVTLQLAEAWGVTPEQVAAMPRGLVWAARWRVYQEAVAKSRKLDEKAAKARAKG